MYDLLFVRTPEGLILPETCSFDWERSWSIAEDLLGVSVVKLICMQHELIRVGFEGSHLYGDPPYTYMSIVCNRWGQPFPETCTSEVIHKVVAHQQVIEFAVGQ